MKLIIFLALLFGASVTTFAGDPLEDPGTGKDFKPKNPRPTDAGEENNV